MNDKQLVIHPDFTAIAIQLLLAYEWIHGGLGKLSQDQFVMGMNMRLARFADGNPHDWYVETILLTAQNSPQLFGQLVQWGELLAGTGLLLSAILFYLVKNSPMRNLVRYTAIAALLGGLTMNLNFYFAAGWSSSSTAGLNILMFWMHIILIHHWLMVTQRKLHIPKSRL